MKKVLAVLGKDYFGCGGSGSGLSSGCLARRQKLKYFFRESLKRVVG
jgi:hypothetical protein